MKKSSFIAGAALMGLGAIAAGAGPVEDCQNEANAAVGSGAVRAIGAQRMFEKCMVDVIENDPVVTRVEGSLRQDPRGRIIGVDIPVMETGTAKGPTTSKFVSDGRYGTNGKGGYMNFKIAKDGRGLDDIIRK